MTQENTQLTLTTQPDMTEYTSVSMDQAVVEQTVDAGTMSDFPSFDCFSVEEIETKFGARILCKATVPGETGVFTFTLTLPEGGKTADERRNLLRIFAENPGVRLTDCALVRVATQYGQDAYLWRSAAQARSMRARQAGQTRRDASGDETPSLPK